MKKIYICFFLLAFSSISMAQEFQAAAEYKVKNLSQPEHVQNFTLTFNARASLYEQQKQSSNEGVLYKNGDQLNFIQSRTWKGVRYLISDVLVPFDWKIQSETKTISGYQCTKAIAQNGQIVAWFTEGIPSNQGPENYFGLSGLILEVTTPRMIISCVKIALLPNTEEGIKAPAQGIKVTQKQFDELVKKK